MFFFWIHRCPTSSWLLLVFLFRGLIGYASRFARTQEVCVAV